MYAISAKADINSHLKYTISTFYVKEVDELNKLLSHITIYTGLICPKRCYFRINMIK